MLASFLRDVHTLRSEGRPDRQDEIDLTSGTPYCRQIEYLYIESDGGFSRGSRRRTTTDALACSRTRLSWRTARPIIYHRQPLAAQRRECLRRDQA